LDVFFGGRRAVSHDQQTQWCRISHAFPCLSLGALSVPDQSRSMFSMGIISEEDKGEAEVRGRRGSFHRPECRRVFSMPAPAKRPMVKAMPTSRTSRARRSNCDPLAMSTTSLVAQLITARHYFVP